jgi:ectoine hydroxylase-related dioxygenase (phytanoyl-CoA dioxygenase family)
MKARSIGRDHAALVENGYCIVPGAIDATLIARLNKDLDQRFHETPLCDGNFYGRRTKRFGGLLTRSHHVANVVMHPHILSLLNILLLPHCDRYNLNLTQAVEIHPGAPAQFAHRDQDMWLGPKGEIEYLVNVMWPLSDFTADNGATVLWPGSHRCQDKIALPENQAVAAEMAPGAALVFLGSTLHGGGANRTDLPRRGIIISYSLGWLKPFENQWLVYPPCVARGFSPELAAMVGYAQHRPNLGNYEGQCPSILLRDSVPANLAATDALRPDQAAMLDVYVAQQRAAAGQSRT